MNWQKYPHIESNTLKRIKSAYQHYQHHSKSALGFKSPTNQETKDHGKYWGSKHLFSHCSSHNNTQKCNNKGNNKKPNTGKFIIQESAQP